MADVRIGEAEGIIADDPQCPRSAKFTIETGINRLVDRQGRTKSQINVSPHPVGGTITPRECAHRLAVEGTRLENERVSCCGR